MENGIFSLYDERKPTYVIENYDFKNKEQKAQIKQNDEMIFKESMSDDFYNVHGYFIRSASKSIVSYLLYEMMGNNIIYISSFGTLPAFEGQGRASQLMKHLKKNYMGYTFKLKVDTFHDAEHAKKLISMYRHFGFEIVYSSVNMEFNPK